METVEGWGKVIPLERHLQQLEGVEEASPWWWEDDGLYEKLLMLKIEWAWIWVIRCLLALFFMWCERRIYTYLYIPQRVCKMGWCVFG